MEAQITALSDKIRVNTDACRSMDSGMIPSL